MSDFEKNKYIFVEKMIPPSFADFIFNTMRLRRSRHVINHEPKNEKHYHGVFENIESGQVPGAFASYGCALFDELLIHLIPKLEKVTGLEVLPTYSYTRMYMAGDELKRHTDRPACEISMTLALGHINGENKVFVETIDGEEIGYNMAPGDAMIYRGLEVPHWREPYTGDVLCNTFLHYVNANGPHTEEIFDKRAKQMFIHFGEDEPEWEV